MKLENVCRPLFQYMCRLFRLHQGGVVLSLEEVRGDINRCFEKMREMALADAVLADQLSKMELPLVFFVDYLIKEGPFAFAGSWTEMARQYNELSGDEKFFDLLDETLNDPTPSATERVGVFYTCLSLGFNGCYASTPDYIERKMKICALRLNINTEIPTQQDFGQPVYDSVNRDSVFHDPASSAKAFMWAMVGFLIFAVAANIYMFHWATDNFKEDIDTILATVSSLKESNAIPQALSFSTDKSSQPAAQKSSVVPKKPVPDYSEAQLTKAPWYKAYQAGTELKEDYDPTKDNQKPDGKKSSTGKTSTKESEEPEAKSGNDSAEGDSQ